MHDCKSIEMHVCESHEHVVSDKGLESPLHHLKLYRRGNIHLAIYADEQILHPVTWMRIANQFFHEQMVTGSWIHVRSHLLHHGIARFGATLEATAVVVDRFDSRAGERAILDVRINADGQPVATYEHEAIVQLAEDVGS